MDSATYDRFEAELVSWARTHPDVVGLIASGSLARLEREPDEWSDHDVWVVVKDGTAEPLRRDASWLPDADRIAFCYRESAHGVNVVYDDGHLVEFAVFDDAELEIVRANHVKVLVDKADLGSRVQAITTATAIVADDELRDGSVVFGKFLGQIVIGASRHGRGEALSADAMIKFHALGNLLRLLGRFAEHETPARLDNLDPARRFEEAFPQLAERIARATRMPAAACAADLLDVAEELLSGIVPGADGTAFAATRAIVTRAIATRP